MRTSRRSSYSISPLHARNMLQDKRPPKQATVPISAGLDMISNARGRWYGGAVVGVEG